ncbi:MAG: 6-phosphofructokinase, partial [Phycisphaerae bacterium]|nr:6-phosphofructokinase [Phycisphaerae bacterium]
LPGVTIYVIMGRHDRFLTGAAVLGQQRDDDGPHLVYLPERPVSMDKFLGDVEGVYKRLGRCVIAVSEGMCDTDGKTWTEKVVEEEEKDAHGNIQLSGTGALADFLIAKLKEQLPKTRMRADTFGYLQRSFPGLLSPVDAYEARYCGRMAVYYAAGPYTSGSVCMQRFGKGDRYRVETFITTLASVAAGAKPLPDEFINEAGNNINPNLYDYVSPLVPPLPDVGYIER